MAIKKSRLWDALRVCIFSYLFTVSSSALAANYTLIDLGTLGGTKSLGYGLNDNRQVTGYSWRISQNNNIAFLYDGNTMRDLGTPFGGFASHGSGINNSGQVAGYSAISYDPIQRGFFYDGITMHDLGTLGGDSSKASGVNDAGQVVGYSEPIPGRREFRAFIWDSINGMQNIGTLGGSDSIAQAINNSGQATGRSSNSSGESHAFIWDSVNGMKDIGTLGGQSFGFGINDSGQVTGWSSPVPNVLHAFFYDGGVMYDIGVLDTSRNRSEGLGINDNGLVVGVSSTVSGQTAFLWDSANGMQDLCVVTDCVSAGWSALISANDINNNGDIAGSGIVNGKIHAFLAIALTPATPALTCQNDRFESPFSEVITLKNKMKRAIPVKMQLVDVDGYVITGSDLSSPPVVNVSYNPGTGADDSNNSDLVPPGLADDGNEFRYDDPYWVINLATKQFTSAGTYEVTAVAGDDSYAIDANSCSGTFIRLP